MNWTGKSSNETHSRGSLFTCYGSDRVDTQKKTHIFLSSCRTYRIKKNENRTPRIKCVFITQEVYVWVDLRSYFLLNQKTGKVSCIPGFHTNLIPQCRNPNVGSGSRKIPQWEEGFLIKLNLLTCFLSYKSFRMHRLSFMGTSLPESNLCVSKSAV